MRRLVAYDGSPSARRALLHATELHRAGDDLGLVHVSERLGGQTGQLDEACAALSEIGIDAVPFEVVGSPAQAICVAAERHAYDTIIVGRRNLHDAGMVLLGSVASRVVSGAHANVIVVA